MTSLRLPLLLSLLLAFSACGGNETGNADSPGTTDETDDTDSTDSTDEDGEPTGNTRDASVKRDASAGPSNTPKDAGNTSTPKDAGSTSTPKDAGTTPPVADAGKGIDAGNKDAGGGIMLPDLGTLFPTNDAGSTPPKTDAGSGMGAPGAKDGPCKDLMLFCFDPFDMFIFNPELCFSCNGGKGCQGCAIPYAY